MVYAFGFLWFLVFSGTLFKLIVIVACIYCFCTLFNDKDTTKKEYDEKRTKRKANLPPALAIKLAKRV